MKRSKVTAVGLLAVTAAFGCDVSKIDVDTLQVELTGGGRGRVLTRGRGIDCGEDCVEAYAPGSSIALVAVAAQGSKFTGWTGGCSGVGDCILKLSGDATIKADFGVTQQRLQVASTGLGTGTITSTPAGIQCGNRCSNNFRALTRVALVPTPAAGSVFVGWSGDCEGTTPCGVTLTADRNVSARFESDQVTLSITRRGNGAGVIRTANPAIDCGTRCTAAMDRGSIATLTATPLAGSVFQGWGSGGCSGVGTCTLRLDDSVSVEATFARVERSLGVSLSGTGGGQVTSTPAGIICGGTCTAAFPEGTQVTLRAIADVDSDFSGWSAPCSGNGSCVVGVDRDVNLTATFTARPVRLTVRKEGNGNGTVSSSPGGIDCGPTCAESFPRNSVVTLTAIAGPGSRFDGWSDGCTGQQGCAPLLSDDLGVVARFSLARHRVAVHRGGVGVGRVDSIPPGIDCGADCENLFDDGIQLTLVATPNPGSRFIGWTGPCSGSGACIVSVATSLAVSANFASEYSLLVPDLFTMGSTLSERGRDVNEGPQRTIDFSSAFWLKTTEVTQAEWLSVMGTNPSGNSVCATCPVETIDWEDAAIFTNRLSDSESLERCYVGDRGSLSFRGLSCSGYRLPTEAEWEFAARAGTTTEFFNGRIFNFADDCSGDTTLDASGWHCGVAARTQPVATLRANAFGLYDMHGNVAEWTQDWFDAAHYTTSPIATDPTGPMQGAFRTVRGGSYASFPRQCRSAARAAFSPFGRLGTVGLRPARTAFTQVPPGVFTMGSPMTELGHDFDESPEHEVVITRPLLVRPIETTQAEWQAVMATAPSGFNVCGPSCPVESVSWDDAVAYANTLSARDNRPACYSGSSGNWSFTGTDCRGYRLPTEAEWEYAARAGSASAFASGPITRLACDDPNLLISGWYCGNAANTTHPVASKTANRWGLFDTNGNVAEWVNDLYGAVYYTRSEVRDPIGDPSGSDRVVRGGSWDSQAQVCRFAKRASAIADRSNSRTGLRMARGRCEAAGSTATNVADAAVARTLATAVFTGSEVIIFGGLSAVTGAPIAAGSAYDVDADAWRSISATDVPSTRSAHAAAWSGRHMLIWGGSVTASTAAQSGGRYDPRADTWAPIIIDAFTPRARTEVASAWTGSQWFIWGGRDGTSVFADGARYVPFADAWIPIRTSTLAARFAAAAIAVGDTIVLAGGRTSASQLAGDYAIYDSATDTWRAGGTMASCSGRARGWTAGRYVIIASETGWCRFDPATGSWDDIAGRPGGRSLPQPDDAIAVSTGAEVLVYGGTANGADGVLDAYEPVGGTWRETAAAPRTARRAAPAVWTGCAMVTQSGDSAGADGQVLTP